MIRNALRSVDRDYFGYARDAAASLEQFMSDSRDRTTALRILELLQTIRREDVLKPRTRLYLDSLMTSTRNPATRIVAGMPAGTADAERAMQDLTRIVVSAITPGPGNGR